MLQLSDPILAATIAFIAAIIVSLINTFWIEHYRRFQSWSSLAGAIAGELSSYSEGFLVLEQSLEQLIINTQKHGLIEFQSFDIPPDKVFDSCAKDIGILGSNLAEDVAYVLGLALTDRPAAQP